MWLNKCEAIIQSWPLQKVFFSDCCLRSLFHALLFLESELVHARGRFDLHCTFLIQHPLWFKHVQTFSEVGLRCALGGWDLWVVIGSATANWAASRSCWALGDPDALGQVAGSRGHCHYYKKISKKHGQESKDIYCLICYYGKLKHYNYLIKWLYFGLPCEVFGAYWAKRATCVHGWSLVFNLFLTFTIRRMISSRYFYLF